MRMMLLLVSAMMLYLPAQADETQKKMHPATFYQRSVAPSFASMILSRSTGRAIPGREMTPEPAPALKALEPLKPLSIPQPKPSKQLSISDPSKPSTLVSSPKLNPHILKRLMTLDPIVRHYSQLHGVDPNLTRAVIYVESAGLIDARSHKGAQGLMQLMPGTANDMGVKNPLDATQNIFGGTRYLSRMLERFGREDLALWAYNAGPESVKRKRLPLETRRYIPNVIGVKRLLAQGGI